jgi:hypothetical protein
VPNDHHYAIGEVVLNAHLVDSTDIERGTQEGEPHDYRGRRAHGPDAPYRSQVSVTVRRDANPSYFKLTTPEPGRYLAVLVIDSPGLYGNRDVRYEAEMRSERPAGTT